MIEEGLHGDELLYRSILPGDVVVQPSGWRLRSTAFNDRNKKPSVNRACISPDPRDTRRSSSDGVVALVTQEVRTDVRVFVDPNAPANKRTEYKVDVFARPILSGNPDGEQENLAHAQIETEPEYVSKENFNKLKR